MSLDTTIARAAASELRLWRSTCTIDRPGAGGDIFDPDQGSYITPPRAQIYSGSCQVRLLSRDRDVEVIFGEASVGVGRYLVKVPLDAPVERGDVVTVTSSPDPALAATVLRVKEAPMSEWQPVRRLLCEELTT